MTTRKWKRKRQKQQSFKPNRAYIAQATENYLNQGGKITVIKSIENQWNSFMSITNEKGADEFLHGGTAA